MSDDDYLYDAPSVIHGFGVFSEVCIKKHAKVGVGIRYLFGVFPYVTYFPGSKINHSWSPNCVLEYNKEEWTYDIISCKDIGIGEEITINYEKTPWYVIGPDQKWK